MGGGRRSGRKSTWALASIALVTAIALALATAGSFATAGPSAKAAKASTPPNIVLVLTDDLSWNLLKYMPNLKQMSRDGATFSRYFVTDSLCCPSRASIFTGRLPHNTGIFTNSPPDGGFSVFRDNGQEADTFATAISSIPGAHYRTAMMGKYLNGYQPASLYVPPGWSEWYVAGNAYSEYNYNLNENGHLVSYGSSPSDYLTDVLSDKGVSYIRRADNAGDPFLLEIATFAPHAPATPAPRDEDEFPGLKVPRTPAFNAENENPPSWLADRPPLTRSQIAQLDKNFRKRAQSVQAVDDLIGRIRTLLRNRGLARNTYVAFSSDNGYHMGDHRLLQGKMTAFDTDIGVPMVVVGPEVPAGRTVGKLTANIDLRPTFSELAGATVPANVDGHSLLPLLDGSSSGGWRTATLVEHHGRDQDQSDPDFQPRAAGNPPTYEAIRKSNALYVEYKNGDREYYNLVRDPYQLDNTYGELSAEQQARLHQTLSELATCSGSGCWRTGGG